MRAKFAFACSLAALALLICAGSVQAQGISEDAWDSLISYWELGELGGVRYDSHAGNDLTDNNTVWYNTDGIIGNAAHIYEDNNEYLNHADNASLSRADESFTISGWVNPDIVEAALGDRLIASKGEYDYGDLGNEWMLHMLAGGAGVRFSTSNGSTWTDIIYTTTLTAYNYYFIAAGYDAENDRIFISVDGAPPNSEHLATGTNDRTNEFEIGGYGDFWGRLDEFAFWGSALSASDISALYNSGNGLAYPFGYARPSCGSSLTDGLISYWKLDEESGVRYDSWGSNHLSDNNTVGYTTTGVIGNAADFVEANSEYLTHDSNSDLNRSNHDLSICMWVKPNDTSYQMIATKSGDGVTTVEYEYILRISGSVGFLVGNGSTNAGIATTITPSQWSLICGIYESNPEKITISVDETYANKNISIGAYSGAGRFTIGSNAVGSSEFNGDIDEIGLWNRALTDAERAALYNSGAGAAFPWCGMMQPQSAPVEIVYLPLILGNYEYEPPDYDLGFDPIDYSGDTTWYDWATAWAEAIDPLMRAIADATTGARNIENDMCDISPYLTGDGYKNVSPLTMLGDNPSIREIAYALGWALGAPVAWVRGALSYANAFDAFWITALIYFVLAGLGWIAFVVVVFYGVRLVRALIDLALMIYDRIPFKAT